MSESEILNSIKSIVHSLLPDAKILLFGSRAKGNYRQDSDYDILVITQNLLQEKEKTSWRNKLNKLLVLTLHAPVDVLINSEKEVSDKKNFPGHVIQWALKDGIWL